MSISEDGPSEFAHRLPRRRFPRADERTLQTAVAAHMLGVTPNTLRMWEQRFGFPHGEPGANGRKQFFSAEIIALHATLSTTISVPAAIDGARTRLAATARITELRRRVVASSPAEPPQPGYCCLN